MFDPIAIFGLLLLGFPNYDKIDQVKNRETSNLIKKENTKNNLSINMQPFTIKWKIQNNSITTIPFEIKNKLKTLCKNSERTTLVKVKTFVDDTVAGTFDCRL